MKKLLYIIPMIAIFVSGCGQINSDEVGFKTSFGKIDSSILDPGLYCINPIGGNLYKYSLRDNRLDITTPTYTKDMQQATFQLSVIFAIDRSQVIDLHRKYGKDYANIIITPDAFKALKNIIGTWDAEKLVNGRELATNAIYDKLVELMKDKPLIIKSLSILDIDYTDAFEKAIEEKVVAAQEAIKAKNKTVQIEEEAKQTILKAEAEAKAIGIRAKALAENKDVIMLNMIEKWDGKAPSTLSIGQGANLFLPAIK